jgi:hypothetical protein
VKSTNGAVSHEISPLFYYFPLDRRLGGPQSRTGRGGEENNSQPPTGIEPKNPDLPARSLVAITVFSIVI